MALHKGGMYLLVAVCLLADYSNAMQCERKSKVFGVTLSDTLSCPGLLQDSERKFCCEDDDGNIYCCDLNEFFTNGFPIGTTVAISVVGVLVILLIGCCICCLCCPCCMLYKRRHQGIIYGRVQQPATVVNVQTYPPAAAPLNMAQPQAMPATVSAQPPYPSYPLQTVEHQQSSTGAPPPYGAAVKEGYSPQAPYNPHFCNQ